MKCVNCGVELEPDSSFCGNCGTPQPQQPQQPQYNRPQNPYGGQTPPAFQGYPVRHLETNRSILKYILMYIGLMIGLFIINAILSLLGAFGTLLGGLLTIAAVCGYFYYIYNGLVQDINIVCAGDGEETSGVVRLLLFSIITCGIYNIFWHYALGNRMAANAHRYDMNIQDNGVAFMLWMMVPLGGVCVVWYLIFKNANKLCAAYNAQHGV